MEYTSGATIDLYVDTLTIDGVTDEHSGFELIHIIGDETASLFDAHTGFRSLDFSGEILFNAGGGNDTLYGSANSGDTLLGGQGADVLDGGDGRDSLRGGKGRDTLTGGDGDDTLEGGNGTDLVSEFGNVDFTLTSSTATTATLTGLGTDQLNSIEKIEIEGWYSNNTIDASGFRGKTSLVGGDGDDLLKGGNTSDTLEGGNNNDTLQGGEGNDTFDGGDDIDRLYEIGDVDFLLSTTTLEGLGTDQLDSIEEAEIIGGGSDNLMDGKEFAGDVIFSGLDGSDTLTGSNTGNDTLLGGEGDDTLSGWSGNDSIDGGEGHDLLDESMSTDYTLYANGLSTSHSFDILSSIESAKITFSDSQGYRGNAEVFQGNVTLIGGGGDDTLQGSIYGDDSLYGGTGSDSIEGFAGDDTLRGFLNNDILSGGDGNDELKGELGNDTLYGNNHRDTLDGGDNNDHLDGGSDSDLLFGSGGWDTVIGGAGSDTLYGGDELNPASTVGTVDFLTGDGGGALLGSSDTFILGDSSGSFYNDGDVSTDGHNDYAYISDFYVGANHGGGVIPSDILQLAGSLQDYRFGTRGSNDATVIFDDGSTSGDLIAIIQGIGAINPSASFLSFV